MVPNATATIVISFLPAGKSARDFGRDIMGIVFFYPRVDHHSRGAHLQLFGRKKNVEHFLCVKESIELVPEHPHQTHRVNPSSITAESSIPTVVMFVLLDKFWATSKPKSSEAS